MGHPLARPFPKIQHGPASSGFVDQPPATESDEDPEHLNVDDVRCDLPWGVLSVGQGPRNSSSGATGSCLGGRQASLLPS